MDTLPFDTDLETWRNLTDIPGQMAIGECIDVAQTETTSTPREDQS